MAILITGGGGQLAHDLAHCFGKNAASCKRDALDITDPQSVATTMEQIRPTAVINCAAYNHVDLAESHPETAHAVNAVAPGHLAEFCAEHEIRFVHVSSDYVYGLSEGRQVPWAEEDRPTPNSVYSQSKRDGELAVLRANRSAVVVRTCGLYGHGGKNFVRTMLRLSESHETVRVVNDQCCTPTSTRDLACWIESVLDSDAAGLIHATQMGDTNWSEFARTIFDLAHRDTSVEPISTEEFGAAAARPRYSVLDCSKLDQLLPTPRRRWDEALAQFVSELSARSN